MSLPPGRERTRRNEIFTCSGDDFGVGGFDQI